VLESINRRLLATAALVNVVEPLATPPSGFQVGVDLGTADIQTIAVDADGNPLAALLDWADVVRDGVVVDYAGACAIVRRQLAMLEQRLGISVTEVMTSFPPGTDPRISTNVVEAAGVEVLGVIDEPSSVAALLGIRDGAVVDVGGGTTGTAIVSSGRVVASMDDATGGRHISLCLAGHLGVALEEAEQRKREGGDGVIDIVRPVVQKMADVVRRHIDGFDVSTLYLTGGSCCLPGFHQVFAAEFSAIEVVLPQEPLYLTPLAIANYRARGDGALQAVR
jgi:ethanolamine utilization protein EutJ